VALGHLHRAQRLAGPAPLHYCGSPLQLDFGETANDPVVNVVDVRPGLPADVRAVPLHSGRRLRTVRGTLAQVLAVLGDADAGRTGDEGDAARDHLRIVLDEPARAGLADEVRERVPDAVEVVLASRGDQPGARAPDPDRLRRTPHDLFAEYLDLRDAGDERVLALFDTLVDDAASEPAVAAVRTSERSP
jgi:exonuclease SbcD